MEVKLTITEPDHPRSQVQLTDFPALVGRCLTAEVHLDDAWVSRQHCEIDELGGGLVIRDLDSRRGTFVNGFRIDKTVLFPGDDIGVGMSDVLVSEVDGKTRAEGSELQDKCEFERHVGQASPA